MLRSLHLPAVQTSLCPEHQHFATSPGRPWLYHSRRPRTSRRNHQQQHPSKRCHYAAAAAAAAAAVEVHSLLAFVPPVCFDAACQAAADRAFLTVISLPLLGLAGSVAYALRPLPKDRAEVFEDPETGAIFEGEAGRSPERDRTGELAFKAISYIPWPVDPEEEGERLRIAVGPVQQRTLRTYVFQKVLPQPSQIISVTMPRPMGIVFEEDARRKRAVVCGFREGSVAEQRNKVAKLNQNMSGGSVQVGDVLRAVTSTNFVYPTQSLFGAKPPVRTIVVFGADGQKWPKVATALKKGDVSDGEVTLVLERRTVTSDR